MVPEDIMLLIYPQDIPVSAALSKKEGKAVYKVNKDSKGFGERVARYRTIREISQTKLAQILDVSTNTIQRIEGGYETKTDKVLPLCIELQISPNELFGYGDCFSELDPILTESLKDIAKTGKSMSPEKQMKFANALKKYVELIK